MLLLFFCAMQKKDRSEREEKQQCRIVDETVCCFFVNIFRNLLCLATTGMLLSA